ARRYPAGTIFRTKRRKKPIASCASSLQRRTRGRLKSWPHLGVPRSARSSRGSRFSGSTGDRCRRGEEIAGRVPKQMAGVAVSRTVRGVRQDHELAVAVGEFAEKVDGGPGGRVCGLKCRGHESRGETPFWVGPAEIC